MAEVDIDLNQTHGLSPQQGSSRRNHFHAWFVGYLSRNERFASVFYVGRRDEVDGRDTAIHPDKLLLAAVQIGPQGFCLSVCCCSSVGTRRSMSGKRTAPDAGFSYTSP
jgi:hypothetical protein